MQNVILGMFLLMFLLLFNMQVSFLLFVNVVFICSVVFVSTFPICYKPLVQKNAYNVFDMGNLIKKR